MRMLVLGICREVDGKDRWFTYQKYTAEDYLNLNEEQNAFAAELKQFAQTQSKFQGTSLHFDSINKTVEIHYDGKHNFSFGDAKCVEISKEDVLPLMDEINKDDWQEFDIFDWGK